MLLPNGAPITDASEDIAPRIPIDIPRSDGGAVKATAVITHTNARRYPSSQMTRETSAGMKLGAITDYFGKIIAEPRAPVSAVVLHVNAIPSLKKGDNIADLGVVAVKAP